MTTQDQNPMFAAFNNLQDGARFVSRMMTTAMQESDKQVAEGMKWMNTLNEHAAASRNNAMNLWLEGMERGAAMTQSIMDQAMKQAQQAFRVQK